jgi:hypothetical protein
MYHVASTMKCMMQLNLILNEQVSQTLSPDTPQKAFADRSGAFRLIGYVEYLDTAHGSQRKRKKRWKTQRWNSADRPQARAFPTSTRHLVYYG